MSRRFNPWLYATCGVLLIGSVLTGVSRTSLPAEDYDIKLQAASQAASCFEAIRTEKLHRGLPENSSDLNHTGMIGPDYSLITTTLGEIGAKRTSTDPNWAAVIADMFHELGLSPGDRIAINCSGSFPALNLSALCAAEAMSLEPVMISSFGASTHGANDPDFTYPDMEWFLFQNGLISHKSDWVSIGGNLDIGTDMDPALTDAITHRLSDTYGYSFFYDDDLAHNIQTRYAFYRANDPIKCFVNIGGNDASFGDSMIMVHADGGILTELSENDHSVGLVQLFLRDDIPVIHLLNLKGLAADYHMPFDPSPLPSIGEAGVYYHTVYSRPCILLTLFLAAFCLRKAALLNQKKPSA